MVGPRQKHYLSRWPPLPLLFWAKCFMSRTGSKIPEIRSKSLFNRRSNSSTISQFPPFHRNNNNINKNIQSFRSSELAVASTAALFFFSGVWRCGVPSRLVLTFSRKIPLLLVHSAVCRVVALSTSKHHSIRVKRQECCASASRYGKDYIIERSPSDTRTCRLHQSLHLERLPCQVSPSYPTPLTF